MPSAVQITGLSDLRAALRAAPDGAAKEISAALKSGAQTVTAAARGRAPHRSGRLAGSLQAFAKQTKSGYQAGVRTSYPSAGVQEWARTYRRRSRSGGTHSVTMHSPAPRFMQPAVDALAPELVDQAFTALVEVLKLHGWFV